MFFLLIPVVLYMLIKKYFFPKSPKMLQKKHVVITGGSTGIGKSVAVLAASRGANVTIIARDESKLKLAEVDIKKACIDENQLVKFFSLDVTDHEAVTRVFEQVEEIAPIYMLVNCAGKAIPKRLEDMSVEDITSMLNLNVLGTMFPTRWVLPKFKARKEGIIVITASQASLIGIYGLSVYCASKAALRGFAEAIHMEAGAHNVSVTLSLPPDTDTPGLQAENALGKPEETALISESGGLFQPEEVAKSLLDDALDKKFFSYNGFESFINTTLSAGMSPYSSLAETLVQVFFMGPFRLIGLGYLASFHRIIRRCLEKSKKQK